MQREAAEYVNKCDQCQRHAPILHQSGGNLNPIISHWPFTQRGLDIIRCEEVRMEEHSYKIWGS